MIYEKKYIFDVCHFLFAGDGVLWTCRHPLQAAAGFGWFLAEAHQTIIVFLNQLQYEKYGLDNAAIGYIYIIATLLGACGFCSAWFTKKTGVKAAGLLLGGAGGIACVMLVFAQTAFMSVSGILLLRISNSLFLPFQTEMQNKLVCTKYRATELSIHAMVLEGIAVGTNLVFGAVAEMSLANAFWFGAGICAVSVILFYGSIGHQTRKVAMHKE